MLNKRLRNGAIVLASATMPEREGYQSAKIVLCEIPHNSRTPFATWQMNAEEGHTYWGHYHATRGEATKEFYERCKERGATMDLISGRD